MSEHKIAPEFLKAHSPEDNLHRAIGVYSLKKTVYTHRVSPEIEIRVKREGNATRVEYQTPVGMVTTTTLPEMRKAIDLPRARGLRDQVKVMVGEAPVNEKFARDIGADGYAPGAGKAVTLVRQWLQKEDRQPKSSMRNAK